MENKKSGSHLSKAPAPQKNAPPPREKASSHREKAPVPRKKKKKRSGGTVVLILFLLILAICLAALGYANSKLDKISYDPAPEKRTEEGGVPATPVPTIDPIAAEAEGFTLPQGKTVREKNVVNILFLGTDLRIPGTTDPGRADSTMLCSLNTKTGDVRLVSFERGIYVPIPGMPSDLLTHAYHWGGAELSESIISQCFLLDLAGYAQVDFDSFQEVIDAIGGVDIELTELEAAKLTGQSGKNNMYVHQELHSGMNHLDGRSALAYCRLRSIDDDWARQSRQRSTIKAALKQLRTLSPTELDKAMNVVLPLIHTDLSKKQIASLVLHAPKFIQGNVEQLQVPDKNMTNMYIKCDFDYESKKISNFIYGTNYELVCPY